MTTADKFPSPRHMKWVIVALLTYFFARILFFAINISGYAPPDEVSHLGLINVFSGVLLLPENTPDSYRFGLVTNTPWLYYWFMGKLLFLNVFGMPDLQFLRLLNLPLALGTLYFAWKLLYLLTDDRLVQMLLVVVMTNTLMFSFLSASVSYDNLVNLLAVMAIYYLFAYFKENTLELQVMSLVCQLAGCLTKVSFLPLSMILTVLWLLHELKNIKQIKGVVRAYIAKSGWRIPLVFFVIIVALVLNLQLYGGNYLRYGVINPDMYKVLPLEIALKNRIAARDMIVDLYKEGRIEYGQAMRMAGVIDHPGDRADTIYLLQQLIEHKRVGYKPMGPVEYIGPWFKRMAATVYGIMGHISMYNEEIAIVPVLILFGLAVAGFIRCWRPKNSGGLSTLLVVLCGAYTLILMYVHNYHAYLYYENFDVGVQGRYLFPVMAPIYVLFSFYLVNLFANSKLRIGISFVVSFIFIATDFPVFLYFAERYWFA